MQLSLNRYTSKCSRSLFFAIDSMHEPAELSQHKLHRLEFDNPIPSWGASLISEWWLSVALWHGRGEVETHSAAYSHRLNVTVLHTYSLFFLFPRLPLSLVRNCPRLWLLQRMWRVSEICPAVWGLTLQWQRSDISPLVSGQITSSVTSETSSCTQTHEHILSFSLVCAVGEGTVSLLQCMNIKMIWCCVTLTYCYTLFWLYYLPSL